MYSKTREALIHLLVFALPLWTRLSLQQNADPTYFAYNCSQYPEESVSKADRETACSAAFDLLPTEGILFIPHDAPLSGPTNNSLYTPIFLYPDVNNCAGGIWLQDGMTPVDTSKSAIMQTAQSLMDACKSSDTYGVAKTDNNLYLQMMKTPDANAEQSATNGISIPPPRRSVRERVARAPQRQPFTKADASDFQDTIQASKEVGTVLYPDHGIFCYSAINTSDFRKRFYDSCMASIKKFSDAYVLSSETLNPETGKVFKSGQCVFNWGFMDSADYGKIKSVEVLNGVNVLLNTCNRFGSFLLNGILLIELRSVQAWESASSENSN